MIGVAFYACFVLAGMVRPADRSNRICRLKVHVWSTDILLVASLMRTGIAKISRTVVYKLVRIYQPSQSERYSSNRRSLSCVSFIHVRYAYLTQLILHRLFSIVSLLMIIVTGLVSIKLVLNFGQGLARAIRKSAFLVRAYTVLILLFFQRPIASTRYERQLKSKRTRADRRLTRPCMTLESRSRG